MNESEALPIVVLTEKFASLPGIGKKSAQRLAYKILDMSDEEVQEFLNQPEADGSAEWITENDQYLVCWEEIAKIEKKIVFEDAISWC